MGNKATNVVVGKPLVSGGILLAPLGTALPTDEVAAPNVAFKSVGYVTDNGFTKSEKLSTAMINAWGGDLIAITQKNKVVTAKLAIAEYLNPLSQTIIYGVANVTITAATTVVGAKMAIVSTSAACPENAWIIEMFSGLARGRIVMPDAQVTDADDVSFKDDDISARGITLTLKPDSTGAYFYEYWNDGIHT